MATKGLIDKLHPNRHVNANVGDHYIMGKIILAEWVVPNLRLGSFTFVSDGFVLDGDFMWNGEAFVESVLQYLHASDLTNEEWVEFFEFYFDNVSDFYEQYGYQPPVDPNKKMRLARDRRQGILERQKANEIVRNS